MHQLDDVRRFEEALAGLEEAEALLEDTIARLGGSAPPARLEDGAWWRQELIGWCVGQEVPAPAQELITALGLVLRDFSDADVLSFVHRAQLARPEAA
jgi:hypothetical protein